MLYGYILDLQAIELNCWKNGIDATLSKLKEFVKKDVSPSISFLKFAQHTIENSDRKARTKDNMLVTVATLKEFRGIIDFKDLNYTFLKDFDVFLRNKGLQVNTIGKHMRGIFHKMPIHSASLKLRKNRQSIVFYCLTNLKRWNP